jgi:beta-lactam-binding protein with PASTA domain
VSLVAFLKSKTFLKQLVIAVVILVALTFLLMQWLGFRTNHGEEIEVPDLTKLTLVQAKEKLEALDLDYYINDTINFQKDFPPNSIVEQDPSAFSKVKQNRKVYLKINASGFEMVEIPDLKEQTYRQALPTLLALGFEAGKITYKPYFAEEVVLELQHNGKTLKPGDKLKRTSKIDFVLGDGKTLFNEEASTEKVGEE